MQMLGAIVDVGKIQPLPNVELLVPMSLRHGESIDGVPGAIPFVADFLPKSTIYWLLYDSVWSVCKL